MKRIFLFVAYCFYGLALCAAPTFTLQSNNADSDIAEYIQDALKDKLSNVRCSQINISLTQKGDALTINYSIDDGKATGTESTSDIWNDLDKIIEKVAVSIKNSAAPLSSTPASTSHPVAPSKPQQAPQPQPSSQPVQQPAQPQTRPVYTQPSVTYNNTVPASNNPVNNHATATNYTLEDVQRGKVSIGDCVMFPDGSRGVVFFLTNDGHGLAVSLDEAELKWENVKNSRQCSDIGSLPNEDRVAKYLTYQQGLQNTNTIIQHLGAAQAPAANWCIQHGYGWYLPSAGELWYLFWEANEGKIPVPDNVKGMQAITARQEKIINGPISRAIMNAGGRPFSNNKYWSSSENDNDDVFAIRGSGNIGQSEKPDEESVRAVRSF